MGAVLPPSELPPCNVLELDCEGAEVEILREMNIQPRVILVETHDHFSAGNSRERAGLTAKQVAKVQKRL
jgi:hypothetical protein